MRDCLGFVCCYICGQGGGEFIKITLHNKQQSFYDSLRSSLPVLHYPLTIQLLKTFSIFSTLFFQLSPSPLTHSAFHSENRPSTESNTAPISDILRE